MMSKLNCRFSRVEVARFSMSMRSGAIPRPVSQSNMAWPSVTLSPLPMPPETMATLSG